MKQKFKNILWVIVDIMIIGVAMMLLLSIYHFAKAFELESSIYIAINKLIEADHIISYVKENPLVLMVFYSGLIVVFMIVGAMVRLVKRFNRKEASD